jgi:hypothetical protein
MSLDERNEMNDLEQLDGLSRELADAGRLARVTSAPVERPNPAFAMRLRSELLRQLPSAQAAEIVPNRGDSTAPLDVVPLPPARPVGATSHAIDRCDADRPFGTGEPAAARASRDIAEDEADADPGRVTRLRPSVRWRMPVRVMPSRYFAAGLAACLAIGGLIAAGGFFAPTEATAIADQATSATIVRAGSSAALVSGTTLREGDEIRVGPGGSAALTLGGSHVRLAAGADLVLTELDANHTAVNQIAGRVYHRVAVPAGGDYTVTTATVTWQAHGTAFDIDRHPTPAGEEVRGLALLDGLDVSGPNLRDTLEQGTSATIELSGGAVAGSPVIEPIAATSLLDAWLRSNAELDARLGLPLGLLAGLVSPEPTSTHEATAAPTEAPTDTVTAPPTATSNPTDGPSARPSATPRPTARPTPRPTARPGLGNIAAVHNSDGTYTLSWSGYTGPIAIDYYKICFTDTASGPFGYVEGIGNCTPVTDPTWTDSLTPAHWRVKVEAIYYPGGVATSVAETAILKLTVTASTATLPPPQTLSIHVTDNGDGTWTFSWSAYTGGQAFDYYKLVFTEPYSSGADPSYLNGASYWAALSPGTTSVTLTEGDGQFVAGDYAFRVEAVGYPGGTGYDYAKSGVYELVLP